MAEKNASFANISTNMQFRLNVSDEKKSVSVARISPSATAENLNAVAIAFANLFVVEPYQNLRNSKDEIED